MPVNGSFAPEAAIRNRIEAMSAIVRTTDSSRTLRYVREVPQKDVERLLINSDLRQPGSM
jgi:hypothetical protein